MTRKDHIGIRGATLLIGFSAVLGLNQALVKLVNAGMSPLFQAGMRSACAFALVLLWVIVARRLAPTAPAAVRWALLAGALFALEFLLLFVALDHTSVSRVSLFFYSMPLFAAVGAHVLLPGERLSIARWLGMAVALSGLALALLGDRDARGDSSWLGDLLALGGALAWAGIALVIRATPLREEPATTALLWQLGVSALLLLPVALWPDSWAGAALRPGLDAQVLTLFSLQVVVVACFAYLMWMHLLTVYPVANVTSFSLLTPIFAIAAGSLIFDDALSWQFVLALLLVGGGLVLLNRGPRAAPASGRG